MLGAMSRIALLASISLSLALAAVGCAKKSADGPSCGAVVDNMMAVTKQQLTGHGELEVQNRTAMIEQCEKRDLTAAQRTCLVGAKDLAQIAACTPRPKPTAAPAAPKP